MFKTRIFLLFLICTFLLLGSCSMKSAPEEKPAQKQTHIDTDELDKQALLAFLCIEQAKLDILDTLQSFPYARISSPDRINLANNTDYSAFETSKLSFTEYGKNAQEANTLEVLCLSEDSWGRRDLSTNRITFRAEKPTTDEAKVIAESIRQDTKQAAKIKDQRFQKIIKDLTADYQKANGLAADGIIGKNTINSLIQDTMIIDIQTLTTRVVYPQEPKIKAYIVRTKDISSAELNKGFSSIQKVQQHALTLNQFKNASKSGAEFLICIYFLDRVHPSFGLRWGFATRSTGLSDEMSAVFYARPNTWPMLVQTFTTESDIDAAKLYINLYRKQEGFLGLNKVIASHEIK